MKHTLDLVITRDSSQLLRGTPTVSQPGNLKGNPSGDHLALYFGVNLAVRKSKSVRRLVTLRKLRTLYTGIYRGSSTNLEQHWKHARWTCTFPHYRNWICCRPTRSLPKKAGNYEAEYSMVFKWAVRRTIQAQNSRKVVAVNTTGCSSAAIQRTLQCGQQATDLCEETFLSEKIRNCSKDYNNFSH